MLKSEILGDIFVVVMHGFVREFRFDVYTLFLFQSMK